MRGNNGPEGDAKQAIENFKYSKDSQENISINKKRRLQKSKKKNHGNWKLFLKSEINQKMNQEIFSVPIKS